MNPPDASPLAQPGAWEAYFRARYVGVPYLHRGRTIAKGLDCWGLLLDGYSVLGVPLFDLQTEYEVDWHREGHSYFVDHWHEDWVRVALKEAHFPDGVLFETAQGIATHAGIVLSDGHFLHAFRATGAVVSDLTQPPWSTCIAGVFRHKAFIP